MALAIVECKCGSADHHGDGESVYYTTVMDHNRKRAILAAGPFETHREAAARVDALKRFVRDNYASDPNADWYEYGTASRKRADAVPSHNIV